MIFTDYSRFQKEEKAYIRAKNKPYKIKFKDGSVFKQITTFEEVYGESNIRTPGYGAWFASEEKSWFLTLEEIKELRINNEIELI